MSSNEGEALKIFSIRSDSLSLLVFGCLNEVGGAREEEAIEVTLQVSGGLEYF